MTTYESNEYDVIVVGGGHAGTEAALASSRMGTRTLLITLNLDMIAFMPCNPSIGGPAKGVVVREIDALGGEMGRNIDRTYIQMRMLNTAKGPAVRALRAQADKDVYSQEIKNTLYAQENLDIHEATVDGLITEDNVVKGVFTHEGDQFFAPSVVLTTGTSSRGEIIIGELRYSSGPNNTKSSLRLSEDLEERGFELTRFKTGSPPRIHEDSVNYEMTEEQAGDEKPNHFSFTTKDEDYKEDQISCWLTYTNPHTHEIIDYNLNRSPMITEAPREEGVYPRYCPSIEDKIVRFADKDRHQIFLEPEGIETNEIYVQGLNTSLPEEVQLEMLHSVKGLENAEMMRPGYAIEYDVVKPYQLRATLETKAIEGLFTAGQMNGTSGYEEAAGQGLVAGINASLKTQEREPFVMSRDESYIGVMIDDLVTKGTNEPYRLLTSRAEYRLLLRHDNADLRLTEKGYELGLVSEERYGIFAKRRDEIDAELERLKTTRLKPTDELNAFVLESGDNELKDGILAYDLLKRPQVSYEDILRFAPLVEEYERTVGEQVEIQAKYEGYIKKAVKKADKLKRMEDKEIPKDLDYDNVDSLASEALEKLKKIRPETVAQASRISGITPADISILTVYIERGQYETMNA